MNLFATAPKLQFLTSQLLALVVTGLVASTTVTAQTPTPATTLRQIIPPSPTAASLGVYGEVGVGYFTGLPDINIPLYEVSERSIRLPIRLQYNAAGTRVAENASWVGLGWSLAAGGVITRTVRGLDDFKDNLGATEGYYTGPPLPTILNYTPPDKPSSSYDKGFFKGVQNGTIDAEPDVFAYNFGSYSGKFLLGKKQSGSVAFVDEQNNLRIEYLTGGWRVTDAKGYQYVFNAQETSSSYSYASTASEAQNDIALRDLTYQPDKATVTTAWYLSSITAPTGEAIRLEYGRGESLSLLNKSEEEYNLLELIGGCTGNGSASSHLKGTYKAYSASKQVTTDLYLKKITFSHGTVEFITSEREDIEYRNPALKPAKLAEIIVRNTSGKIIKSFRLAYSYFGSTGWQRRLKLDALAEIGQDSTSKPPYKFAYNQDGEAFYDKYSKSIDHWGYYNGRPNTKLLPELAVPDYSRYLSGADRRPDTTGTYLKQGVLAAITYPTGGRTAFDYEIHDYGNLLPEDRYQDIPRSFVIKTYFGHTLQNTEEFNIATPTPVTVNYGFNEANCAADGCQLRATYTGLFFLDKLNEFGSSAASLLLVNNTPAPGGATPAYRTHEEGTQTLLLLPGRYRARVWSVPGYSISMNVHWNEHKEVHQQKGGGLRIKTITNFADDKQVRQRKFIYTTDGTPDSISSGILITHPTYALRVNQPEDKLFIDNLTGAPVGQCAYTGLYMGRMSSLLHPVGFSTRATVGYRKVTELVGGDGEGGRVEYSFDCESDGIPNFPGLPSQGWAFNGKLKQRLTYAATGELVKSENYLYEAKNIAYLSGVKVFISPAEQDAAWSGNSGGLIQIVNLNDIEGRFFSGSYSSPSSWVVPKTQVETSYATGKELVVTKDFSYDNDQHKEITREQVTTSAGDTRVTHYLYPSDYANTTGFIGEMKAAHILSAPVEQVTGVAAADGQHEQELSGTITTYHTGAQVGLADQQWTLDATAPISLADFKFSNQATAGALPTGANPVDFSLGSRDGHYSLLPALRLSYDAQGQLQQLQKRQGVPTVYLWSYAHALPVAQLDNATTSQVLAALGAQSLSANTLPEDEQQLAKACARLRQQLPQAHITSLTHQPLVGVSSQTDPTGRTTTYEYDVFGRLLRTRDEQGRILSQQQYHYAGK